MRVCLVVGSVSLFWACSSGSSRPSGSDGVTDVREAAEGEAGELRYEFRVAEETAPEAIQREDARPPADADWEAAGRTCEEGAGCFLDKCGQNNDCQSGWCVEHMGEGLCSRLCQDECPQGWSCKQVAGTDPDVVFICVSDFPTLCRPCTAAASCQGPTRMTDACVRYGDSEGSFCGGACAQDDDCPWGFVCKEVPTVEDIATYQCVAEAGICPCTAKSAAAALSTSCALANAEGSCTGKRTCTEDGLSACDAATPAAETCDGQDSDCDGETDEPAVTGGQYVGLCEDGNECTADDCLGLGGCAHEPLAEGECKDGNSCTVGDHCEAGVCVGEAIECDDENPCTDDSCTPTGGCAHEANSLECDDGDACTVGDHCKQSACAGTKVACDCQEDGDCEALEDGNLCNGTLFCDQAMLPYECEVVAESVVVCPAPVGPDGFCQEPACEPLTGACGFAPDHEGLPCEDGDACTVKDLCKAGLCEPGQAANCSDGNPCTDDLCDQVAGCLHADNTSACDDDNPCTLGDSCAGGQCLAGQAAFQCDDGNPCTLDVCHPQSGCQHDPVAGDCSDGNPCTTGDTCSGGQCVSKGLDACDDGNACTDDSCSVPAGCAHWLNALPCEDGNPCTLGDQCSKGLCVAGVKKECGDGNPCTEDACDAAGLCSHAPKEGACSDGNPCTTGDHCAAGWCVSSGVLSCDDGNACTDDSCDSQKGCSHQANQAACDDGSACTTSDHCAAGWCVFSGILPCDDDNQCTDDGCEPATGCTHLPNDLPCDDSDPCTLEDSCLGGSCAAGFPKPCDDGVECTLDGCDGLGACTHEPVAAKCDDGNDCTEDKCAAGLGCQNEKLPDESACGPAGAWFCLAGTCVPCIPDCGGKSCGGDGCGASCGQCKADETCQAGKCIPLCKPYSYGTAGIGVNNGWTCTDVCNQVGGASLDWTNMQEQIDMCQQLHPGATFFSASPSNFSYPIWEPQNNLCKVNQNGVKSQNYQGNGTPQYGDQILCKCSQECPCSPACGPSQLCVEGKCQNVSCPGGFQPVLGGPKGRSWWQSSNCTGTEYYEPPPFPVPYRAVSTPLCRANSGSNFPVKSERTSTGCHASNATATTVWLEVKNAN